MCTTTISFGWDEVKQRTNVSKHCVSFSEAQSVFYDPHARLINDPDHSEQEDRFILLGMSSRFRLLVVCHSYHDGEGCIRIISARRATRFESRSYRGKHYEK